jgi:excinuclease ABC subunit C
MKDYSASHAYEKAEVMKKRIEFLENYQSRSVVANAKAGDMDVFSVLKARQSADREKDIAYVNYLMVRNGAIIQTQTNKAETHLDESAGEILSFSIAQLRKTFNSDAAEIIVPFAIEYPGKEIMITVPKGGDRKKLLDLSEKNARHFIEELENKERLQLNLKSPGKMKLLAQLQEDLQLPQLPVHIECFDNSNLQGSYPVSAMVCFRNGEPSKKDYRHFNIKTVKGINDFASMKEAVSRRYKRLANEKASFPQLVIIDGGKGQLSSALEAISALGLNGKMTLVGLAKNEEELFFSGDTSSLKLPYNSDSLKFIRRIRDEVHRFGITFHRQKRSKGAFSNELEQISGIGQATADLLLKEFKSVSKIKEILGRAQNEKQMEKIIGKAKAKIISDHFLKER